jgi:hypothetical protein
MIGTNYFSVFFDVEFEYEVGFSLAITVFAVEGETTIFWDPVYKNLYNIFKKNYKIFIEIKKIFEI